MNPTLKKLRFEGQTPVLILHAPKKVNELIQAMGVEVHAEVHPSTKYELYNRM
jgi:hypothetical protein